jgi:CubicO group peptidase (beta-lactamase class C family)
MRSKLVFFLLAVLAPFTMKAQTLYFPPVSGNTWDTISPQTLNYCQTRIDSLYAFLDTNNTKAFILLKDGKIVLEKYFGTHTPTSFWQWASAGKTITSFLTGIAQQENHISISDTTSNYLGQGWTSCTQAQEEKITVRHQLTMTSGLDDGVADVHCTVDSCLLYKADGGTRWSYHNAPYTLLDSVIESATGLTLNTYPTQKLKTPTGMTGGFIPVGFNNVFFSNARSMARFGLLVLNKGNWDGTQVMTDTAYFNQMVNTSQQINKSYGYLWWLNGKSSFMLPGSQFVFNGFLFPDAPADALAAMGKDGQFLNVIPSRNMVWIRMGESPDGLPVPYLLNNEIWKLVNDLNCTSGIGDINRHNFVHLFPNPGTDMLHIKSDKFISKVEILNIHGQLVKTVTSNSKELNISISELSGGLFFIRSVSTDGSSWTGKLIKDTGE